MKKGKRGPVRSKEEARALPSERIRPRKMESGRRISKAAAAKSGAGRSRAKDAWQEVADQFRAMSAAARDAIIIIDNVGRTTFWNEPAEKIFGYSHGEIIGKTLHDVLAPERFREKFRQAFPRWRESGQGEAVGTTIELVGLRKDGTEIPIELSLSSARFKGRWNAIATVRDITERRRTEEELRFRNVLLSTQQDVSPDGILVVDDNARILSFNRRFVDMWGIPETVLATKSDELAVKAVLEKLVEPQKFVDNLKFLYEHRHETSRDEISLKDGRTFERYSAPMFESGGRYYGRVWFFRDITIRTRAQEESRRVHEELSILVKKLEDRNIQNVILGEMREFLQGCSALDEIGPVIFRSMKRLLPGSDGALFLLSPSKTDLESAVRWGAFPGDADDNIFPPDSCWALRRGGVYVIEDTGSGIVCPHLRHPPSTSYACLPLMAKGDVLGLLHIRRHPSGEGQEDLSRWLANINDVSATLSELLSLSISNIKLRETLSHQSIRDPLTGLFNRRYMEENFQREISRAARKQERIGVVMADIDRFKMFNDLHGHAAGDIVLVELAKFFRVHMRESDIICRYGGEEFALILPESLLENTAKRARQLVDDIKGLTVLLPGQVSGKITLSMGVAAYPDHGSKQEDLLRAADAALYRAKQEGRDRVVVA